MAKQCGTKAVSTIRKIRIKSHPNGGYGLYANGRKRRWVDSDGCLCLADRAETHSTTEGAAGFAGKLGFKAHQVIVDKAES